MRHDSQTTDLIEDMLIELCGDFDQWFGSDPDFDHEFAEQGGVRMLGLIMDAGAWLIQTGRKLPPEFLQLKKWFDEAPQYH